ncbi:response regulator [Clostridium botulinum]|nr:response regulator [Clostridium botulinum]MCS4523480.1 response regulator [Clostridium botulinum]MCS4526813.1 response regulator [Clostridium botulinum]
MAENGQEGFELFKVYRPDIVITDLRMPIMNGIDMIKR